MLNDLTHMLQKDSKFRSMLLNASAPFAGL